MKSLLPNAVVVTMLLSLSFTASAQAKSTTNTEVAPTNPSLQSEFLIASPFRKEISPAFTRRKFLMEMLIQEMKIQDLAEQGMQSEDAEIKAMSEKILQSSMERSRGILNMLNPLDPPFRNPR